MSVAASIISLVLSSIAVAVSTAAFRQTVRKDRTRHVDAIFVFYSTAFGDITETNHDEIIVRNDGDATVTIQSVEMAYGSWWTVNRNEPESWVSITVHGAVLLPPGEELKLPAPDDPTEVGIVGPVIYLTDTNGRSWQKMPTHRQLLDAPDSPPRRRDVWFERRKWWDKVNNVLTDRAVRQGTNYPGRFPWLAILIDWAWGWRPGPGPKGRVPLNAPLGWRYAIGAKWKSPEIDKQNR